MLFCSPTRLRKQTGCYGQLDFQNLQRRNAADNRRGFAVSSNLSADSKLHSFFRTVARPLTCMTFMTCMTNKATHPITDTKNPPWRAGRLPANCIFPDLHLVTKGYYLLRLRRLLRNKYSGIIAGSDFFLLFYNLVLK